MYIRWLDIFLKVTKIRTHSTYKVISLLFIMLLSGCVHRRPLNLTIAKEHVEQYYECGQYVKDLEKIINQAIKYFKKISPQNNAAVIFDVDDTILSDYGDEKSISFGYIPKLSHEWVLQAKAPAIPQTKRLYDYLVKRGFHIVFLTGRKSDEYDATIKNLKAQGLTHFDKLIVREAHEKNITAFAYKTARRKQLVKEGYRIVGNIGDQESDLKGGNSGYIVKLPNYQYFIP